MRQRPIRASDYHNRGKPKRVLCDDGTDYFAERNLTRNGQFYRDQLARLDRLERMQLTGSSQSVSRAQSKKHSQVREMRKNRDLS